MRTIIGLTLFLSAASAIASDDDFVRAWEATQRQRPAVITTVARIAPPSEPGSPLAIRGRVVGDDGKTVIADAVVFAWHTDATGVYDRPGAKPHSWRLRGWARTDAKGIFVFHTIRPAAYPNGGEAPHVHFSIVKGTKRYVQTLRLSDKPSAAATASGREIVDVVLKLERRREL